MGDGLKSVPGLRPRIKELEAVFAGQVPGKITGQDVVLRAC